MMFIQGFFNFIQFFGPDDACNKFHDYLFLNFFKNNPGSARRSGRTRELNVIRRCFCPAYKGPREQGPQPRRFRIEAEGAEARADLSKAAEIRYGKIPSLEKDLETKNRRLKKLQMSRRILKEEITEQDIADVVSRWTGIPVSRMMEEEAHKLSRMEDELKKRIVGQDEAVKKISDTIKRSRAGIADPNRPIGSFIFLGPTGVGKTELTKALAGFLFSDDKALIRVDMSEFMEKHAISKLIGSPPGYVGHDEGGGLTEMVRHRPYSVILFDEIEKAHPEVFNILLQVLDNGRLTDSKGRSVNFKNTVIIMTSNIGAQFIEKMEKLGFSHGEDTREKDNYADAKSKVMASLKDYFRPEFLNRLDDIIVFDILSKESIEQIVKIQVQVVVDRLKEKDITPINYVVSKNLHRRHLTPTDKALSAIMYKEMLDKSSKLHPRVPNKNGKLSGVGHNLQEAAKAFRIGINTVQHMLFLRDSRSDLFDKVIARQLSPNTAYRLAKAGDKNGYRVSQARKRSEEYITAENEAIAQVNKLISQGWNFELRVENGIYKAHFYGLKMEKPLVEWNMGYGFSSFLTAMSEAVRMCNFKK
jgi:DNA polymerase III delta prime subunit